jgi:hypothetical protein
MQVKFVTSYRVSHLQRYGVTVRGNVTNVDPPLGARLFVLCTDAVTRDLARRSVLLLLRPILQDVSSMHGTRHT